MEGWLPNYQQGRLRIPGRGNQYAELVLSQHLGNESDSTFLVSISLGETLRVTKKVVQMEQIFPLARAWKGPSESNGERRAWGPWRSEYYDFRLSIAHDGLGHFEMTIRLEVGTSESPTVVETPVMVDAGWIPNVSDWWQHFFEHPQSA